MSIIRKFILIMLVAFTHVKAQDKPYANLTIIVSSCDKYADLWPGFFSLLFRQWPQLATEHADVPIILIANAKKHDHPRVTMANFPNEVSWSDNMIETLKKVKTSHVLFLLDDYFLTHFDHKRFQSLLNYCMQNPNVAYMQVHTGQPDVGNAVAGIKGVFYKKKNAPFITALQASIWRTEDFAGLLRSGESPWDFEKQATKRSRLMNKDFLIVMEGDPLAYLNMMHMGFLQSKELSSAKELGIALSLGQLRLDTDYPLGVFFKYGLKNMITDSWGYLKSRFAR